MSYKNSNNCYGSRSESDQQQANTSFNQDTSDFLSFSSNACDPQNVPTPLFGYKHPTPRSGPQRQRYHHFNNPQGPYPYSGTTPQRNFHPRFRYPKPYFQSTSRFSQPSESYQQSPIFGYNSSFCSPNSTQDMTYSPQNWRTGKKGQNPSNTFDISRYLHPSFMEDPWAKLEAQYKAEHTTQMEKDTNKESSQ